MPTESAYLKTVPPTCRAEFPYPAPQVGRMRDIPTRIMDCWVGSLVGWIEIRSMWKYQCNMRIVFLGWNRTMSSESVMKISSQVFWSKSFNDKTMMVVLKGFIFCKNSSNGMHPQVQNRDGVNSTSLWWDLVWIGGFRRSLMLVDKFLSTYNCGSIWRRPSSAFRVPAENSVWTRTTWRPNFEPSASLLQGKVMFAEWVLNLF